MNWEIFENMDEMVTAANIRTHKLVYLNRRARFYYDLHDPEEYKNKTCFEIIKHCEVCCVAGDLDKLPIGRYEERSYYDPENGAYYLVKETVFKDEGELYRVQLTKDLQENCSQISVKDPAGTLSYEAMRLASLQEDPEDSLNVFLEYFAGATRADQAFIYEGSHQSHYEKSCSWIRSEYEAQMPSLEPEIACQLIQRLPEDQPVILSIGQNMNTIPPKERDFLYERQIHNLIMVPMISGSEHFGFCGLVNPDPAQMELALSALQMSIFYLIACLRRRNLILRTQQEKAEQAVQHERQKISETLAGAKMGVWTMLIKEPNKMYMDATVADLVGYPADGDPEEAYNFWFSHVDPNSLDLVNACVVKLLDGQNAEVTYPYIHPEKGIITIRCGGQLNKNYKGPGRMIQGYHQDISDYADSLAEQVKLNKILLDQAQENLDMINDIIESGPWYVEFNPEGQLVKVSWSEPFKAMVGFDSSDEFPEVLESWTERIHPEDKAKTLQAFWDTVDGESKFNVKYRLKKKTGEYEWFHSRGKLAHYPNGSPRLFLGTFINISRDLQAQQALEEAFRSASRANEAKTHFLSTMSHDIRTPLNAITGMAAIAAASLNDPAKVRHNLKEIGRSSDHLLSLVNEVLDMNRIESGKVNLNLNAFSMPELVKNVAHLCAPLADASHHDFRVKVHFLEHERVIGDQERIQKCLMNLLANAIKYTPDGGRIRLSLSEKKTNLENRGCYEFVVEDNGIGMDAEFQKHIFEPFARADSPFVDKKQGSGLGMAITYSIIQMMSGEIKVDSVPGKGSRFTATIFLELQPDQEIHTLQELTHLPILVADSNMQDAISAACHIKDLGLEAVTVASSNQVRTLMAKNDYFALLLSMDLADVETLNYLGELRRARPEHKPLVLLCADDWGDSELKTSHDFVDNFISKPIFRSRLAYLLKEAAGTPVSKSADSPLDAFMDADFSGRKVLLAEDNELNAEIAQEILEMSGLDVDHVWNGQEAVEVLDQTEPGTYNLVLLDIQMPVMNGLQAAGAIRAHGREDLKTIPIVAMSANAFAKDVFESRRAGMNDHMAKPLDFDQLIAMLHRYLD